jgi:hypothetical protein
MRQRRRPLRTDSERGYRSAQLGSSLALSAESLTPHSPPAYPERGVVLQMCNAGGARKRCFVTKM